MAGKVTLHHRWSSQLTTYRCACQTEKSGLRFPNRFGQDIRRSGARSAGARGITTAEEVHSDRADAFYHQRLFRLATGLLQTILQSSDRSQNMCRASGVEVQLHVGGDDQSRQDFDSCHIAVCTIEKADSIIQRKINKNEALFDIGR